MKFVPRNDWPAATELYMTGTRTKRGVFSWAVALLAATGCLQRLDVGNDQSGLGPQTTNPPGIDCPGNVEISTTADWVRFQQRGCARVLGSLVFADAGVDLEIINDDRLEEVQGNALIQTQASSVSFSRLVNVDGSLDVIANPRLVEIRLPALVTTGRLNVERNHFLPAFELERAEAIDSVVVHSNSVLEQLRLELTTARSVEIRNNPRLKQCLVDAFTARIDPAPEVTRVFGNDGTPNVCP